ncbi:MAG: hypothetical protein EZS28_031225 [Streblomastix strix]|uniref:Uncharacterized protein n=1 Tax=Streblomastix strix TaxID=222440 RepID=A0A5J4US74_9EUKA|nr:MAG: hypothetical protein EZS28_031225 [Streblomastix strix]
MYESAWYDSGQLVPDQVTPASDELPLVDGTASAGISTSYSRGDHVHPQQLTYDNDITATKFIMTGGTNQQILLANGDTTTLDSKLSRTYNSGTGGYIRLCVFPAGTSTGAPYIQFQVQCNTNAMQTIDLVPNYTVNGISALYGVFTAPSYVQTIMNVYYGVDQLLHTHTGTGSQAIYSAWIHMMSGSGIATVTVSKQGTYWPTRVTEILTQDIVTSITGSQTQIPMSFNLGTGGIIGNMLQVNPLDRNYSSYSNGIRIGNNNNDSSSSLYLGCIKTAINTTQAGQWEISKTSDNTLTINPSTLRQADHSVGLNINSDCTQLKFNNNELVNVFPSADIRNPLSSFPKSDVKQITNSYDIVSYLIMIPAAHYPYIYPLYQAGSTPNYIQLNPFDAFAIRIPSLQFVPVGFTQNTPLNVFLPLTVQSVPALTNSLPLNFIIELSLLILNPTL